MNGKLIGVVAVGIVAAGGVVGVVFKPPVAQATATSAAAQATITVIGHGDEQVAPDTASIDTGIVTKGTDAESAQKKNDAAMEKLLSALKQEGITAKDVHTQGYGIHPDYSSNPKTGQQTISDFEADDNIEVEVHNLSKVGSLVDAIVRAGANQINGVNYKVSKPLVIEQRLYDVALADAKSQAQHIASSLGVTITGVQSVDTTLGNSGPIMYAASDGMSATAAPISPGTQDISTSVKVVYTVSGSGK